MSTPRSVVIHGHFYQPPREDPWLDEVEAEPSAAPYHDWNERIEQDCYRAVAAARIPGAAGRIARIANTYEWLSFNFGPTLLEWLEHAAPDTYEAVIAADRASVARLGHGNAIAMPYHHAILPLSTRREKATEVRWGIADFRRRFGREPEGMWLPETAVDEDTLDVLAEAGIRFTILAPHQVDPVPPRGLPGLVRTASGRTIVAFVYDGRMSHDVAFGPLIRDGMAWSARVLETPGVGDPPQLVSVATDGETYGHHHPFGEMALAMMLERVRERPEVTIENFGSFLARHGVEHETRLMAPSAWSCPHGVERWRSDCGCRIAPDRPTHQRWRAPLRDAIAWLAAQCHHIFDRDASRLLQNPAEALAGYGSVLGAGPEPARQFGRAAARAGLGDDEVVRAIELLEMERGALRTFTSCAWFFDDISGIEALQVLRYAAWLIGLAGPDAAFLEEGFTRRLAPAESNARTLGTGRDIYLLRARPHIPPPVRIAAGLASARRIAPEAAASRAWLLEGPDDALTLTSGRTGRRYLVRVACERTGLELRVTVRSPLLDGPVALRLEDLPERQRTAIAAVLRGEVLARLLSPDERAALDRGDELRPVIRHALSRRVRTLADDHGERARHEVSELLVILEQLGQAVPFEVQTVFYRIWQAGRRDEPGIVELARRMGFDTGAGS
jgi:alpha-amylase/alpha-mannosidase (GH57 family)